MAIQYQTDENGRRVAVVIPVEEWEALRFKVDCADDVSPELLDEAMQAKAEMESGVDQGRTLAELERDIRPGDPEDDVTPEEAARMAQALDEYRRGEFSDLDDVCKRLACCESNS